MLCALLISVVSSARVSAQHYAESARCRQMTGSSLWVVQGMREGRERKYVGFLLYVFFLEVPCSPAVLVAFLAGFLCSTP